jgi:hypothetical protein
MSRLVLVVPILVCLASLAACSGQQAHVAGPDSSDPAWQPPGEMSVMVRGEAAPAPVSTTTTTNAALKPNKREILAHQIRAANYDATDSTRPTRKALTD